MFLILYVNKYYAFYNFLKIKKKVISCLFYIFKKHLFKQMISLNNKNANFPTKWKCFQACEKIYNFWNNLEILFELSYLEQEQTDIIQSDRFLVITCCLPCKQDSSTESLSHGLEIINMHDIFTNHYDSDKMQKI